VLVIHAGTALSHRIRHQLPNSVNVINPDMSVLRYDYDAHENRFKMSKVLWQAH
jgi:hypothetical protein